MKFENYSEADLPKIAAAINSELDKINPFVLWLDAEMGMGKTTLVKHLLQNRGWSPKLPVQSPTFTYVQTYDIMGKRYAHIDLYRLENKQGLEKLGLEDVESFDGVFVEWPKVLTDTGMLMATHSLKIEAGKKDNLRTVSFEVHHAS